MKFFKQFDFDSQAGFTLIEILVVMVIIGILATLGAGSFQSSQMKGRDARRKAELKQIRNALETYYNDTGQYPLSSGDKILGCGGGASICNWGEQFVDDKGTVYMVTLPTDPRSNYNFNYQSADGSSYQLFARLENVLDASVPKDGASNPEVYSGISCGDYQCNYGTSSSNTTPSTNQTLIPE